ncbi:hypothetical protein FXV83_40395 [Bradyrhizobium hipponense]|uniref:Uncharacterized protein n=1 Tax=Bradyrhizobium hipponense TaxID=2605638 RepID=A0A5S4YAH4_9BRAD|nr:hypothetical protein FXV83_40395 [Bradyrhizobium hipponense]
MERRAALDHSFPDDTALCGRLFLFLRQTVPTSVQHNRYQPSLLLKIAVQHADSRGLFDGLIWPKTGCASIV